MTEELDNKSREKGQRKGTRETTGGSGNGRPFNFGAEFAVEDPEESLHELPLEEVLYTGPSDYEKKSPTRRMSVRNFFPALSPVWNMLTRTADLRSISHRYRMVAWHGMAIIVNLEGLEVAREAVSRADKNLSILQQYRRQGGQTYKILHPYLLLPDQQSRHPQHVSASANTGDNIESLAALLGMPSSMLLKMCMVASFATSIKWVRKDYRKLCLGEIEEFDAWLATSFDIPS